jgi:hypothetical protein
VTDAADNNRARRRAIPVSAEDRVADRRRIVVTEPVFPAGRYGRRRSGRRAPRWVVPALAGVLVLVLVGILWRVYASDPGIGYQVLKYQVADREVAITFEVTRPAGRAVSCVLRARSRDGAEVGREVVAVPTSGGNGSVVVTHTLTTKARPVTGEVEGCGLDPGR